MKTLKQFINEGSNRKVNSSITSYLMGKYSLDCPKNIRYVKDKFTHRSAVECFGSIPSEPNKTDWFFAGFKDDIKLDMRHNR
ncbi:MAG: hypothetical protein KAS32_24145 [Candidatus Peribacteraceae bacterium]|nr:hypothetical protein [Candidatus Peribacteraceae bacterium]